MDTLIVFVTCPDAETAVNLARSLVEERLVACGNVVTGLRSIYRWQGRVHDENEVLLLLKTTSHRYPALEARIRALHPYQVPEVLAVSPTCGLAAYLTWVDDETRL